MSERLTGRCADNNEPYAKFHDYVSCADRLAEIEDMVYDASGNEIISLDRLRELAEAEREGRIRIVKDEDDRCLNCVSYLGLGECAASDGGCGGTNFHCDWHERKPKAEAERALAATEPKGGLDGK